MNARRKSKTFPQRIELCETYIESTKGIYSGMIIAFGFYLSSAFSSSFTSGDISSSPAIRRSRRRLSHRLRPTPSVQVGCTEWRSSACHLGGYVRMAGQSTSTKSIPGTPPHRRSRCELMVQRPLATRVDLRSRPRDQSHFSHSCFSPVFFWARAIPIRVTTTSRLESSACKPILRQTSKE